MTDIKHIVEVANGEVTTKVVKTITQLNQGVKDLLSTIRNSDSSKDSEYVVGLDIERQFCYQAESTEHQYTDKVVVLKLCFDETCLIIQLLHIKQPLFSLFAFLQRQELTFAGVGIRHCLVSLNRDYGIKCRNVVDLGEMVAVSLRNDRFRAYGLRALANQVKFDWIPTQLPESPLGGWDAFVLSQSHIEGATCDAYLCYRIAYHTP